MMAPHRRTTRLKKLGLLIPLLVIVLVSITLLWYSPDELLALIGVRNAYLVMFVLAMIGGMSTFTGVPYHFILMSFAAGGMSPLALGTITALGVMLGDSTSYLIGKHGGELLPKRFEKPLTKLAAFLSTRPRFVTPFLVLYGAFSPLSNDFIVISMGLIRYSYWKVIVPLTVGNIFYNVGLAYIGYYAFEQVQGLF